MSNKLFVGNLSFNTTETQLRDAFSAHGIVAEVNLMMDRETGRPRGFGFVTMNSAAEAQAAIDGLNGKSVDGRDLTVNVAKPREERPAGGGGGRREYGGSGGVMAAVAAAVVAAVTKLVFPTSRPGFTGPRFFCPPVLL